jgi:hypothetical protein
LSPTAKKYIALVIGAVILLTLFGLMALGVIQP